MDGSLHSALTALGLATRGDAQVWAALDAGVYQPEGGHWAPHRDAAYPLSTDSQKPSPGQKPGQGHGPAETAAGNPAAPPVESAGGRNADGLGPYLPTPADSSSPASHWPPTRPADRRFDAKIPSWRYCAGRSPAPLPPWMGGRVDILA